MHVKYSWKLLLLLQGKIIYMFNIFSNTKKVVRSKQNGSSWQYEVTHWRTETIKKLYERCRIQHPAVKECGINYFAKFIPWFVRTKPKYTGLCWRHDLGKFFTDLLCKRRIRWHQNCTCLCLFCTTCNHGKNPEKGNCHAGTCIYCIDIECPIEWDDTIEGKN